MVPGAPRSLPLLAEMCAGFGTQASLEINHNGKDSDLGKTGKPAYNASRILPSHELWRAPQQGREMLYTIEMDHQKIKETLEKYALALTVGAGRPSSARQARLRLAVRVLTYWRGSGTQDAPFATGRPAP